MYKSLSQLKSKVLAFYQEHRVGILIFLLLLGAYLIWFVGFYPAVMSPDSWSQWHQNDISTYNNHHPFVHTLYIGLLTKLGNYPATAALFQTVLTAGILGYIFEFLHKRRVPKLLSIGLVAWYAISPVVGIYNVTLWKDVTFSQMLLLLSCLWVIDFVKSREGILKFSLGKVVMYALIIAFASVVRHNGLPYLVIFPAMYLIARVVSMRTYSYIQIGALLVYVLISFGLKPAFNVKEENFTSHAGLIQVVAGVQHMGGELSQWELDTIDMLIDHEVMESKYTCMSVDPIVFYNPDYHAGVLNQDEEYASRFRRAAFSIIMTNLPYALADRMCLFSNLIGLGDPDYSYLYHNTMEIKMVEQYGIELTGPESLRGLLNSYLSFTSQNLLLRFVFWSHITYLLVGALYLVISFYKRSTLLFGFLAIIFVNVVMVAAVGVAKDFRYLYMVPLTIPLAIAVERIQYKPMEDNWLTILRRKLKRS